MGEGSKKEALMSSYLLAPHNRMCVICCCSCVGGGSKWGWPLRTQIFVSIISPIDDHYQSFDDAVKTDVDRKERGKEGGKEGVLHPSNSYYNEK